MENLLTVADVAGILKKSENAVRMLRQRGILPNAVKVGHSVYFRERDIQEMLKPEKRDKKHDKEE